MRTFLLSTILLLLSTGFLFSQEPGVSFNALDVNQAKIRVYNSADMGWDLTNFPAWEIPVGNGVHGGFAAGLWIGGKDLSTNLHMSAQTYRTVGNDFYSGPYRTTGNYEKPNSYEPSMQALEVIGLSNGRVLFLGDHEMEEYDPATGNVRAYNYTNLRLFPNIVEKANGDLLLFGDEAFPARNPLVEIDQVTFTGTVVDTLDNWYGPAVAQDLGNGEVLFAGFFGCERYNLTTQAISAAAGMNTARLRSISIMLPNGNVFVSGGTTTINGSVGLISTEIYDVAADNWTIGPAMSMGRRDHSMVEADNGEIVILGGSLTNGMIDHFDPVTGTMTSPNSIDGRFVRSSATKRSDGRILIAVIDVAAVPLYLFIYDPVNGTIEEGHTAGLLGVGGLMANGNLIPLFADGSYKELDRESTVLAGQKWQKVWKISRAEIDQFILDYQNGNVDFSNYPDIEDWPAHGSVADGEDEFLAPFVDVDMDSIYDPLGAGDYPCIVGDQAMWWVFNDDGPHTESGGTQMNVQVEAMAYAFACDTGCPVLWLDHTTFFHYEVTNKGFTSYNDVYLSYFSDGDVGNWIDNYYGVDTALNMGFAYNGDAFDEELAGGTTFFYPGYGDHPPAVGNVVLDAPLDKKLTHYMVFSDTLGFTGLPNTAEIFHNFQQSIWPGGNPLTIGGIGSSGTVPTNYSYPGDPGFCGGQPTGWYHDQPSILNSSGPDMQCIQSVGPFDLDAGQTINYDFASIYARSYNFENLASVCELKAAASQIIPFFANLDKSCLNIVVGEEEATVTPPTNGLQLFPNPAQDRVSLELEEPIKTKAVIEVFNQYGQRALIQEMRAGSRTAVLSTEDLPNGVYFVRATGKEVAMVKKLTIQR